MRTMVRLRATSGTDSLRSWTACVISIASRCVFSFGPFAATAMLGCAGLPIALSSLGFRSWGLRHWRQALHRRRRIGRWAGTFEWERVWLEGDLAAFGNQEAGRAQWAVCGRRSDGLAQHRALLSRHLKRRP